MDQSTQSGPTKAVSQLGDCMAQAAESQRLLFQEMTSFAREEGLRFVNLRLERNGQALEKLQNCHGIPGLIGVQQEWLRTMMQDYLDENMRLASTLRGLAQNAVACAAEAASDSLDRMHQEAGNMARTAGQQMERMAHNAADQAQPTQH